MEGFTKRVINSYTPIFSKEGIKKASTFVEALYHSVRINYFTPINSTSNTNHELAGITPGISRAP